MRPYLIVSAHRYVGLADLKDRRATLLASCRGSNIKGSILLSPEGINLCVAGEAEPIDRLLAELRTWPGLEDLPTRVHGSERQPFIRMLVRVKKEIVAFDVDGINPARRPAARVAPHDLKQWLDQGRTVALLDVRNRYEIESGTFLNSLPIGIEHFHEFPAAATQLPATLKSQPIVALCSSGIRSEKAAIFLKLAGFANVWSLDGGILNYFEQCAGSHYAGDCFMLDHSSRVDPGSPQAQWTVCLQCRHPLTAEDQQHTHYEAGRTCPYCFRDSTQDMAARIAGRHDQIRKLIVPLPGNEPTDHFRPLTIPAQCDGQPLIDALCHVVNHVPRLFWQQRIDQNLLLDDEGRARTADAIVRTGERYRHKFPGLTEPAVNMQVEVLHEDEALVVLNKPAPLPMHIGGRFHRNTLQYLLDALYHPQKLRPAHRLDANTTGLLVVARTRHFAGKLQTQFARGEVEKTYLVRVLGHPADAFTCDAPISAEAGHAGSRIVDHDAGRNARTEFQVLQRLADGTSLVEARPLTGRTNQIRVHLWHLGFPVCGDPVYLSGDALGDSQTLPVGAPPLCLHAWRLRFKHPVLKEMTSFTAPTPSWFEDAVSYDDECAQWRAGDRLADSTSSPST